MRLPWSQRTGWGVAEWVEVGYRAHAGMYSTRGVADGRRPQCRQAGTDGWVASVRRQARAGQRQVGEQAIAAAAHGTKCNARLSTALLPLHALAYRHLRKK
jgi:hypothetical protein